MLVHRIISSGGADVVYLAKLKKDSWILEIHCATKVDDALSPVKVTFTELDDAGVEELCQAIVTEQQGKKSSEEA